MEDFNGLLHDQQLALLQAQFSDCGQSRRKSRETARAIGRRIDAHPYAVNGLPGPQKQVGGRRILGISFA